MAITPFDAYRYYQSIKLHFSSGTYSAVKYNFKTSCNERTFWSRRDKYFFAKAAKKFNNPNELIAYYIAFFVHSKGTAWIGDIVNGDQDIYTRWQKSIQSLHYNFKCDLQKLIELYPDYTFDDFLRQKSHEELPTIIVEMRRENIAIETVVVLHKLTSMINNVVFNDTIFWPDVKNLLIRYSEFVIIHDKSKYINTIKTLFS